MANALPEISLEGIHYIVALDPGPRQSAIVRYRCLRGDNPIEYAAISPNDAIRFELTWRQRRPLKETILVIEKIARYGMPVGETVFDTCQWTGRFIERWFSIYIQLTRVQVKSALHLPANAKDSNVRQAVMDRFKPTGGGKTPQVGIKKQPGPLYAIKAGGGKDVWQALALALATVDIAQEQERR